MWDDSTPAWINEFLDCFTARRNPYLYLSGTDSLPLDTVEQPRHINQVGVDDGATDVISNYSGWGQQRYLYKLWTKSELSYYLPPPTLKTKQNDIIAG